MFSTLANFKKIDFIIFVTSPPNIVESDWRNFPLELASSGNTRKHRCLVLCCCFFSSEGFSVLFYIFLYYSMQVVEIDRFHSTIFFIQYFYCFLLMEHDYSFQFAVTSVVEAFHVKRIRTGESNN